jgi:death-on-curing protein
MPKLTFLNLGEVLEIHRDQIVRYGGLPGLRDLDLLKSAVAMSQATFDGTFLHTDIFEMAAAYLFHIVGNHPFLDGNKRVGTAACLVFLELNGYEFTAPEKELAEIVFALARGEVSKADIAIFVRNWTVSA